MLLRRVILLLTHFSHVVTVQLIFSIINKRENVHHRCHGLTKPKLVHYCCLMVMQLSISILNDNILFSCSRFQNLALVSVHLFYKKTMSSLLSQLSPSREWKKKKKEKKNRREKSFGAARKLGAARRSSSYRGGKGGGGGGRWLSFRSHDGLSWERGPACTESIYKKP